MFSSTTNSPRMLSPSLRMVMVLGLIIGLSGCDYAKSLVTPKSSEELYDDGIALGAGCRQAGQTLEQCYSLNPKSVKSGIYAGWKEMHEYMAAMNIKSADDEAKAAKVEPVVQQIVDPKQDPGATAPKDDLQTRIAQAREKREARRAQLEKEREEKKQRRLKAQQAKEQRQEPSGSPIQAPAKQ